ncbi:alpha/beta fold hydrolase [Cognatishimia sp. F0-27]|uniref:alpha/beta fold hydrolase n=1 Tax=Cognatishimia sp. F0-27 TaxID=2816855 RepID=UPI001D0CC12F|nr:alpha/beta hydrolase [Cognatishimia sp. F0-27]
MARLLLVHGASHGAWCWRDLLPALRGLGHDVRAIDLPSHGADPTPVAEVTLDCYADAILDAIDAPSVVLGHSMAGFPISVAASRAPERITGLIYLCAYIPRVGMSLAQMRKLVAEQPLLPAIRRNPDGLSMHFDPEMAETVFYRDCPPGTLDYALPRLTDQALAPMETAFEPGPGWERVPKTAILCSKDGAIPFALQRDMAATLEPDAIRIMQTGHSPFFADPGGLAAQVDSLLR